MTKDEIKKALEICADISIPCNDCPYDAVGNCTDILCADTLKLIIEQEKEFERLKDDYAKLQEQFAQYQMASDKEIIAQKKEAEQLFESNMKAVLEIEKKQAKIDVLKKLKERAIGYTFLGEKLATETDIDGLIEEVENETKKETSRSTV